MIRYTSKTKRQMLFPYGLFSGRLHQVPKLPIVLTIYKFTVVPHYFPNY